MPCHAMIRWPLIVSRIDFEEGRMGVWLLRGINAAAKPILSPLD
jgi:hypothetical protein